MNKIEWDHFAFLSPTFWIFSSYCTNHESIFSKQNHTQQAFVSYALALFFTCDAGLVVCIGGNRWLPACAPKDGEEGKSLEFEAFSLK